MNIAYHAKLPVKAWFITARERHVGSWRLFFQTIRGDLIFTGLIVEVPGPVIAGHIKVSK